MTLTNWASARACSLFEETFVNIDYAHPYCARRQITRALEVPPPPYSDPSDWQKSDNTCLMLFRVRQNLSKLISKFVCSDLVGILPSYLRNLLLLHAYTKWLWYLKNSSINRLTLSHSGEILILPKIKEIRVGGIQIFRTLEQSVMGQLEQAEVKLQCSNEERETIFWFEKSRVHGIRITMYH